MSNELQKYEPTTTCEGVDDDINPVHYFQKSHPKSRALGGEHALSDLMLLGGEWRGIAHVQGQLVPGEETQGTLQALASVRDVVLPEGGDGCLFDCMASESEFQVFPVIVKRPDDYDDLEPLDAAVAALGISRAVGGAETPVRAFDTAEDFLKHVEKILHLEEGPDVLDRRTMLQAARQLFLESGLTQGRYVEVVSGDEDDEHNPVLVFWLGSHKQLPYLVGLMSAVIWT